MPTNNNNSNSEKIFNNTTNLQQAILLLREKASNLGSGGGIDTNDATATPDDILIGKSAYVQGEKVIGTMPNNGEIDYTIDGIDTTSVTISQGYTSGGVVKMDGKIDDELDQQEDLIQQILEKVNSLPDINSVGGEKPTLFAPSIELNSVSSELTITDDKNGAFAQGYNLYANDELITVLTSKTATLNEYIEHTETIDIKVQATSANFNPSDYTVVEWTYYAPTSGTVGLAYSLSSDGTYATCTGIGEAVETDIEIASEYEGVPVTEIAGNAFYNCSTLTSVKIPNSVTSIGQFALAYCGFTSVVIPDSVTSIGASAFYSCTYLNSVTMGSGVKTINYNAFKICKKLKRVDFSKHTSVPTLVGESSITNTADLQIKVQANLIDSWKSATNWATYADKIVTEFTNEV